MKNLFTLSTLIVSSLTFAQNYSPIPVTGYNVDVIAESAPALSSTSSAIDGSDYVLYNQTYGISLSTGSGLPDNGMIISGSNTYQLNPYTSDNCILLSTGQTDSLELTTPASFSSLSFLGFSAEGDGTILFVIKFTDGSGTVVSTNLADWFSGTGSAFSGFDRTGRADDIPEMSISQPHMYQINIDLSCADQLKLVQTILIINTTPSPSIKTALFALSGAPVVTASSILDFQNPACFGNADGSIQLTPSGLSPITYSWSTTPAITTQNLNNIEAGTYTCTITDATGCTAQLTQILTEPAAIESSQTASICEGEIFTVGTSEYTLAGTYTDVLSSSAGCDSVVTTTLTVTTINNSASISGHVITAGAAGAQYQWLDCDAGYAIVPGETNQTFSPGTDGTYAVAVTINNCTDTSSCILYSTLGFTENLNTTISCSPNPVSSLLQIQTGELIQSVETVDLFGKAHNISRMDNALEMSHLSNGIYLISITTVSGNKSTLRIVKQ